MVSPSAAPTGPSPASELLPPSIQYVITIHFLSFQFWPTPLYSTDIIPQDDWFEDLFSRVYKVTQPTGTPLASFSESGIKIDELALLFAYFAMGALVDLDLTPFNYEAEAYACLSRSALTSMNVLKNATIITIETLVSLCPLFELFTLLNGDTRCFLDILRYLLHLTFPNSFC